jgi:hypothetical protein
MSLQTLKRKTAAKVNISGRGPRQIWMSQGPHGKSTPQVVSTGFSLNGGHRNIGRVGQTNLGRSVTRTPFRGNAPVGHGGTNGSYVVAISNSGACATNRADMIKPSSLNTKGMLAKRYRWREGGGAQHHGDPAHNPVKPDSNYPLAHSQGSYIESKSSTAVTVRPVAGRPLDYEQYKSVLARRSLRNWAYCKDGRLCPPGSCPTCAAHYESTTGALNGPGALEHRLGLDCTGP